MNKDLGKLHQVELREIWNHEATDFTKWLSQEENLSLLSDEIGVEIKLIQTEANVGKFNVDILAEEEGTERKLVIENQLEDTNHDHLGKIVTYASGYDAEIIIWIAKNVRDEHKKAIEWLNEHTDENISFFLIKVELWQIGDSKPAPKFDVIVSPNEWAKTIKSKVANKDLTDTKLQQLEFWTEFKKYVKNRDSSLRLQTPRPQHWYSISMGSSEAHIDLTANTRDNLVSCSIYINNNKDLFNFLKERSSEIEAELGLKAQWEEKKVASIIWFNKEAPDMFNPDKNSGYFEWLYTNTVIWQKVFGKYIKQFKQ